MTEQKIVPERVTKPIQLLAAWLVGLILVNGSFLVAAQQIVRPDWASGLLVAASVLNVPAFLIALFLLQTKFRPQLQEDVYYSQYLQHERKFTIGEGPKAADVVEKGVVHATEKIVQSLGPAAKGKEEPIAQILRQTQRELLIAKHGRTRTLSELYLAPDTWPQVVQRFSKHESFIRDIEGLLEDGLAEKKYRGYSRTKLTKLGEEIAAEAEAAGGLFSQTSKQFWERTRKELSLTDDKDEEV